MSYRPKDEDEVSCKQSGHMNAKTRHASVDLGDAYDMELKAGNPRRLHLVAIKPSGSGSQFSLVYVQTRGDRESL